MATLTINKPEMGKATITTFCTKCREVFHLVVTNAQVEDYQAGADKNIQDIFPDLANDERELLITGICGSCFDALFSNTDEEE